MEKAFSLFRVFDVAFFVPGILLFTTLTWQGWLPTTTRPLTERQGAIALLASVAAIYVLGVTVHGTQRAVSEAVCWTGSRASDLVRLLGSEIMEADADGAGWYRHVSDAHRETLASYFWYMRATCRNLAVAIMASVSLVSWAGSLDCGESTALWVGASAIGMAALLLYVGADYDRALRRAV